MPRTKRLFLPAALMYSKTDLKTWTGLPVEESIRMTEDRDKWRKYVHGSRMAKEQSRTK